MNNTTIIKLLAMFVCFAIATVFAARFIVKSKVSKFCQGLSKEDDDNVKLTAQIAALENEIAVNKEFLAKTKLYSTLYTSNIDYAENTISSINNAENFF
jgi:septal ring factor EnvC (AmiA/AmiB activator)